MLEEMRREWKWYTRKYLAQNKAVMKELGDQRDIQKMKNGRSKSVLISNHIKYRCIKDSSKRNKLAEWIFKNHSTICCLQGTHFKYKNPSGLMWKDRNISCKEYPLQDNIAEVTILLSCDIDFKTKIVQ